MTVTAAALMMGTAWLLRSATNVVEQQLRRHLSDQGVDERDHLVLLALRQWGPSSQRALALLLSVNRTSMVGMIDDLEARGLVKRIREPRDRRAYRIEMTPEGQLEAERQSRIHAQFQLALAGLLPESAEQLDGLLARIIVNDPRVERHLRESGGGAHGGPPRP